MEIGLAASGNKSVPTLWAVGHLVATLLCSLSLIHLLSLSMGFSCLFFTETETWPTGLPRPLLFSSSHTVTTVFTAPAQVSNSQKQHLIGSAHLLESTLTGLRTQTPRGPASASVDITSSDKPSLLQPPGQAGIPPMSSHCLRALTAL